MNNQHINNQTAEAINGGATAFIEPLDRDTEFQHIRNGAFDGYDFLPHKVGDIIWLAEEFKFDEYGAYYKADERPQDLEIDNFKWFSASEMQEHQSRFKGLLITDIQIKRVQELTPDEIISIMPKQNRYYKVALDFRDMYDEMIGGYRPYAENNLIAIYTFKNTKDK